MWAAFAVSGAFHEALFDLATMKFNGGMMAFFMVQGGLVAVTTRSRFFRRLVREAPALAWFVTLVLMLVTGILIALYAITVTLTSKLLPESSDLGIARSREASDTVERLQSLGYVASAAPATSAIPINLHAFSIP